ncbi:NADH-quinone oxidoreductase subunit H [bacterium]|nr:NADH-quinone oxidoreductase subunit H [bacterium]
MAVSLLYFFVYPGLLFMAVAGGLLSWFDRKITARVQFRKGPPLLQPFWDFLKLLLVKETILPGHGSRFVFLLAPVLAVFGASMAGLFILLPLFNIETGFKGDIIVIFYLLTLPSFSYIIGSLASGNPIAAVGASREMKLIISYELTFLLIVAAAIIKSGQEFDLNSIIAAQQSGKPFIGSISGLLLFIAGIFCIQAKLGLVPFDMPEAEAELASGIYIEYSGPPYAMIRLAKYIMLFILPAFIVALLMNGMTPGTGILWFILKLIGIVLLVTLIRNTNPRLKIKQASSFFLIWMNLLVIIAIVLNAFGL